MEFYSALKWNEILIYSTAQMYLENIMVSEIIQTQKYKYYMILLYGVPGTGRFV
jgi:hypothetical protein